MAVAAECIEGREIEIVPDPGIIVVVRVDLQPVFVGIGERKLQKPILELGCPRVL